MLRKQGRRVFESHVTAETQMMLQCGLYAAGWMTLPADRYRECIGSGGSSCDVEVLVDASALVARDPNDPEWAHNAPCRVLSFDIECYRNNPGFPNAITNQIACICCSVQTIDGRLRVSTDNSSLGDANYDRVDVFVCGTCDPIERYNTQIHCFHSEEDMLLGWTQYVSQVDPDVLTGFNSKSFDERYIIDRGLRLGLLSRGWRGLGRLHREKIGYRESKFQSRAFGERTQVQVNMAGRVNLDLLEVFLREFKLPSYTLNYLAQHFLRGDKKVDVPYSAIPSLFRQNARTRQRLCYYCVVDTVLPLRLLNHLKFFYTVVEMSRMVSCVFPTDVYVRGVQIKVFSAVLRENELDGHTKLFPAPDLDDYREKQGVQEVEETLRNLSVGEGEEETAPAATDRTVGFQGATVLEPVKGYHENPVCFDFKSLYPSIHNARNVSHDTEIPVDRLGEFPELTVSDVWMSPSEPVCYVKVRKEEQADGTVVLHRQGFLPRTLQKMLANREAVKQQMKVLEGKHREAGTQLMADPVDSVQYSVLDAKQKSVKVVCNSVYGATGATGPLGHMTIGSTITAFGREFLLLARDSIIKQYPGSVCVGGDTDSVFMKIPGINSTEDAERREGEFAAFFRTVFPPEMTLEYEKTFEKLLLLAKKRYMSVIKGKLASKGVELVRRDQILFCQELLRAVIERIFFHNDVQGAIALVRQECRKLLEGQVPLSKLVTSRQISREEYKSETQPHIYLRDKMIARGDRPPQLGERVPFLTVKGIKGEKAYQCAEDPDYVLEHDIPLDYVYYLKNKTAKALIRTFYHFIKYQTYSLPRGRGTMRGPPPVPSTKRQRTIYGGIATEPVKKTPTRKKRTPDEKEDRHQELSKEKHIHRLLFGQLTQLRPQLALQAQHGISGFVNRRVPCALCRALTDERICPQCRAASTRDEKGLRARLRREQDELAAALEARMSVCRTCLGCATDAEVLCGNTACPEYFPRRIQQIETGKYQRRQREIAQLLDW